MEKKVPELENYVGNGYNCRDGRFLGKRVFKVTYKDNNTINWKDDSCSVPDQISYSASTAESHIESTKLMETKSDYDRLYSVAVDAEYSGVTFSGSLKSEFMYHGTLFEEKNNSYALSMYQTRIFEFERIGDELTEHFIEAILGLPEDIMVEQDEIRTAENVNAYFSFFESYGTHYLNKGQMGGNIVMMTSVKDSLIRETSEIDVKASITAGYDAVVTSGNMDIDAAKNAREFTQEHENSFGFDLQVMGGSFTPSDSGEAVKEWKNSVYDTPRLMLNLPGKPADRFTELDAISNLVELAGAEESIIENINKLIPIYVSLGQSEDGLLTTAETIEFNKAENNTRDGFLIGRLKKDDSGTSVLLGYDDVEENPTELRAAASITYGPNSGPIIWHDKYLSRASLTMPSAQDTHFKVRKNDVSGSIESELKFIGFSSIGGSSQSTLGEWSDIPFKSSSTDRSTGNIDTDSDGFLVGLIETTHYSARGQLICRKKINNKWQEFCGASVDNITAFGNKVSANSFCIPISKGTTYDVSLKEATENINAVVSFVPLSSALCLSNTPKSRDPDIEYSAETDGFLVTYLSASSSGRNTGYANLFAYGEDEEVTAADLMTGTSVAADDSFFSVPVNTAMTPILKDQDYIVKFDNTRGSVSVKCYWISLDTLTEDEN